MVGRSSLEAAKYVEKKMRVRKNLGKRNFTLSLKNRNGLFAGSKQECKISQAINYKQFEFYF